MKGLKRYRIGFFGENAYLQAHIRGFVIPNTFPLAAFGFYNGYTADASDDFFRSRIAVTIIAECPHCENKYNLKADLVGKSMRCPNLGCRAVFTVQPINGAGSAPAPTATVTQRPNPKPVEDARTVAMPAVPKVVEARVVEGKAVTPPPMEVEWTGGGKKSDPIERKVVTAEVANEEDIRPLIRRRKKKRKPVVILGALAFFVFVVLGITGFFVYRMNTLGESQIAKKAEDEFKAGQFPTAAKSFQQLADEYPNSADAEKYRFLAELAAVRATVQSVTNREDPTPSLQKFQAFVSEHRDSPLAKPGNGTFGTDVHDGGVKIADDLAEYALDRVKRYKSERTKQDELSRAETTAEEGRKLLKVLDSFRDPAAAPADGARTKFEEIDRETRSERQRAKDVENLRNYLADPSDEKVAEADVMVRDRGLDNEADVKQIIGSAKASLRKLVKYFPVKPPAPPVPAPPVVGSSLLFATPIGKTVPSFARPGEAPGIFLAAARGILYAFDERTGTLLWAARTGADANGSPARCQQEGTPEAIVLVTTDLADAPALTARMARTGQALWHQPLPAPAAGPAVVVGRRAYIPTRDPRGTIVEFDLTTGSRLGAIALGQPIGPGAVRRAGTGLLYVAADARRVFAIDTDAHNDDGGRVEPRCVQVIPTGHSPGTLRTAPLVVGPEGFGPEPRLLVLCQANGPQNMLLRAFRLPDPPMALAANADPAEVDVAATTANIAIPGWPWFPPANDGERLGLATDAGQFRLFGVNQPGNQDADLFPIGTLAPKEPPAEPMPGLVMPGTDDLFWVLADGTLAKVRLSLDPVRGQGLMPAGNPTPLGVPTQPAYLNATKDTAYFVVRSPHSAGYRAVAVDLIESKVLWTRQLGLVPPSPPVLLSDRVLLADEDGGLTLVPNTAFSSKSPGDRPSEASWSLAPPLADAAGPTALAATPDDSTAWAVTPHSSGATSAFTIRQVAGNAVASEARIPAPGKLAGAPLAFGNGLLLPLTDGFVYRFDRDTKRLTAGPVWRDIRMDTDAVCFLTGLTGDEFLATDGNREAKRFSWPADGSEWKRVGEKLTARERIALPPVIIPGNGDRKKTTVLLADQTGSAWLYDLDDWNVLRRWRSGGISTIPTGPPKGKLALQRDASGKTSAAYIVDGKAIVILDPDAEAPRTASAAEEIAGSAFVGSPCPTADGRWIAVDLSGRCSVIDGATGERSALLECGSPGTLPITTGTLVGQREFLVPLADGSAALVQIPEVK